MIYKQLSACGKFKFSFLELSGIFFRDSFDPRLAESEDGEFRELTVCTDVHTHHICVLCTESLQSCLTLCNATDYSLPGSSVHGILQAKNTGEGCHALLQGIFPIQGLNPYLLCLLHRQAPPIS